VFIHVYSCACNTALTVCKDAVFIHVYSCACNTALTVCKDAVFRYVYSCACNTALTVCKDAVFRYVYSCAWCWVLTLNKVVSVCVETCLQHSLYYIQEGSVYVCAELYPQHSPCWLKMTG
jgi:hypothetical protein